MTGKFFIGAAVLVALFLVFSISSTYSSEEIVTITVTEKERIVNKEDSKYLIFTKNEVFENTDTILYFKFNSSDIYRLLEPNNTYKVKVSGYRIEWMSSYRNIIEIVE